jgi:hypothetical protein
LARIDVESAGELEQIVEREVAPAALDLTDECPVKVSAICERLLAQ